MGGWVMRKEKAFYLLQVVVFLEFFWNGDRYSSFVVIIVQYDSSTCTFEHLVFTNLLLLGSFLVVLPSYISVINVVSTFNYVLKAEKLSFKLQLKKATLLGWWRLS